MANMQTQRNDLGVNHLPSRDSVYDHQRKTPIPVQEQFVPGQDRFIPGGEEPRRRRSWEERLGPIGIAVGAIIAGVLAWFVATKLF